MTRKPYNDPHVQLTLFDLPAKGSPEEFRIKWWKMHNYEPVVGGMTELPVISKRLDTGHTLYTSGQKGYVHKIIENKVIVFLSELWSATWKVYENTWLVLDYKECNPVTMYNFNRDEFEKSCPNIETPEHIKKITVTDLQTL